MEEVVGTGWQVVGGIQEVVGEVAGRGWQAEVADRGEEGRGVRQGWKVQGGQTRHSFSLAWLEEDCYLSEGGLARLMGSGFKKGCVKLSA